MQTIFALATARAKSGVAVIRISGPDTFAIGTRIVGDLPESGQVGLRVLKNHEGAILDTGLVLAFKGPVSFTGEDILEFQIHGSIAVINAVEDAVARTGLARLAERGEFTKRALLNGRMDLSQVEGLSDLIEAETEGQREQAQSLFTGELREFAGRCRTRLLRAAALIEATIDFADEEVPVDVSPEVNDLVATVVQDLDRQLEGFAAAERLRSGFEVAIVGPPNVGKSTLMNRIAGRDIAITSEIAGTTRDVLEVRVDLFGLPVTFLDTAGLRRAEDVIEEIGVNRALARAANADLRVVLQLPDTEIEHLELREDDLILGAKSDLFGSGVSGLTGYGVDQLLQEVYEVLADRLSDGVVASHERHRLAMMGGVSALRSAMSAMKAGEVGAEVQAAHLRQALHALDSLTGRIDVEAVLGEIFAQFCIGK